MSTISCCCFPLLTSRPLHALMQYICTLINRSSWFSRLSYWWWVTAPPLQRKSVLLVVIYNCRKWNKRLVSWWPWIRGLPPRQNRDWNNHICGSIRDKTFVHKGTPLMAIWNYISKRLLWFEDPKISRSYDKKKNHCYLRRLYSLLVKYKSGFKCSQPNNKILKSVFQKLRI